MSIISETSFFFYFRFVFAIQSRRMDRCVPALTFWFVDRMCIARRVNIQTLLSVIVFFLCCCSITIGLETKSITIQIKWNCVPFSVPDVSRRILSTEKEKTTTKNSITWYGPQMWEHWPFTFDYLTLFLRRKNDGKNKLSRYLGQTDLRARCAAIKSAFVFILWHLIYFIQSIHQFVRSFFFLVFCL